MHLGCQLTIKSGCIYPISNTSSFLTMTDSKKTVEATMLCTLASNMNSCTGFHLVAGLFTKVIRRFVNRESVYRRQSKEGTHHERRKLTHIQTNNSLSTGQQEGSPYFSTDTIREHASSPSANVHSNH